MFRQLGMLVIVVEVLGVPVLAAGTDNASPIPKESTERFLERVPNYAGGQPSPSIVHPTRNLGQAAAIPPDSGNGPAVSSLSTPPASQPLAPGKLQSKGGQINRENVSKQPVTSSWR